MNGRLVAVLAPVDSTIAGVAIDFGTHSEAIQVDRQTGEILFVRVIGDTRRTA